MWFGQMMVQMQTEKGDGAGLATSHNSKLTSAQNLISCGPQSFFEMQNILH